MTAAQPDADTENAGDEVGDPKASETAVDEQADADEDQPAIDEAETADLDAIAEQVQAETTEQADADPLSESDDAADDAAAASDAGGERAGTDALEAGEDSVGDFYVDTLVSTSNLVIEEHGTEGAEEIDGAMLRQLGVDDAVDELLAGPDGPDMAPEHKVLLGTGMFALAVLATRTDLLNQALADADFGSLNQ